MRRCTLAFYVNVCVCVCVCVCVRARAHARVCVCMCVRACLRARNVYDCVCQHRLESFTSSIFTFVSSPYLRTHTLHCFVQRSNSYSDACFIFQGLTFTYWGCWGLCLWHKSTELPTPFHSLLVSVSVFMALSTVFYSINSPANSPLSRSVLPVLFLPYWSFRLYISAWKSPSALI